MAMNQRYTHFDHIALTVPEVVKSGQPVRVGAIAGGFGVEAARADTLERLDDLVRHANARPGPFLVELVIP